MLLDLANKQLQYIAQGSLTNSKMHASFSDNTPTHIESANGPYCTSHVREKYIDLSCALGAISIGHNNPQVNEAVQKQLTKGNLFTMSSPIEVEAAEFLLDEFLSTYDAVKYLKTGAEATTGATTIARAATGRQYILSTGYHGHHPQWCSMEQTNYGIEDHFYFKKYDTIDEIINSDKLRDAAAVIVEPILLDDSEANTQKLFKLKAACEATSTLLIFDEIVCGMRNEHGFISRVIKPDLICIGKGIANGFSLSGIVGKKHLMHDTPYFISSTFAGECLPLAAHLATLKFIKNNSLVQMCQDAKRIQTKIASIIPKKIKLKGYGTRGYFEAEKEDFALFQQECIKAGVLFNRSWFMNYSHIPLERIIESSFSDASYTFQTAKLEGRMPRDGFKRL